MRRMRFPTSSAIWLLCRAVPLTFIGRTSALPTILVVGAKVDIFLIRCSTGHYFFRENGGQNAILPQKT